MSTKYPVHAEIVRANARALSASVDGARSFADRVGISDSHVSQMLGKNPIKNIGPSMARRIEQAFGKPTGWLDISHSNETPALTGNIGDRLDEAMRVAGYASQASLARASGVPQPTINRVLKGTVGNQGPETETVKRLAQACGVPITWLIEGSGPAPSDEAKLTAAQREWLALLDDLGSADVEEFKAAIKARQARNRQLIAELMDKRKRC